MSLKNNAPYPVAVSPERRWWHEIPMTVFYVPVFFAVFALMLKHRSVTAPLKANWDLKNGGLFPESKNNFAKRLPKGSKFNPVAKRLAGTLTTEQALRALQEFNEERGNSTNKLVLKPDDGIQGKAVHIIDSETGFIQVWETDAQKKGDWLLQDYVDGVEVALFYIREKPEANGRIISMTWKHGFEVEGDGVSPIRELVNQTESDEPTRKRVLKYNLEKLDAVPDAKERLDLIPVRNHHLGATFQDISDWITPALEAALIKELDPIQGYNYGRLDVRVPNFNDLFRGENIKMLEANALYSEPVHAYDPKYGLWDAYKIFFKYWGLAFRIGKSNRL